MNFDGFIQMVPGLYKSEKPIINTGIDKVHLKCNRTYGSIVNCVREPILYSFALDKPPYHKIYTQPRVKLYRKRNKSVLSQITIYLEVDDDKPVDFSNGAISFARQLIKI